MKYILIMVAYYWAPPNFVQRAPSGWSYIKTFQTKEACEETGKELAHKDILMSFDCIQERP